MTHHMHILEANGESYRLKDSKRRGKRFPAAKRDHSTSSRKNQAQPSRSTDKVTPSDDEAQPEAKANADANADTDAESRTQPETDSEADDNA